jgi:GNAT superfamily N-acetyltransferase
LHYSSAIIFRTESTMTAATATSQVHDGGSQSVKVAELKPNQWQLLKVMRLLALQDAPAAFVNTSAAERALTQADWQDRFDGATWVVARIGLYYVGIARLAPPEPGLPWVRFVESVWVDPDYRGLGVLREMVEHLEGLARAADATELRLWVLDTNESADRAYRKLEFGHMFVTQETAKRAAGGRPVMEHLMSKPIL